MSYNGSGVFNINTSGQPVVTGTVISSTAFNALTADLATGLTTALTKDGQTTPTANIKLGGFKLTGIGVATTSGDALSFGQVATVSSLTNSSLTSGRVTYASTAGLLVDSANLTFNGTTLTAATGANFATSSGSVGIGTTSPGQKLTVQSVGSSTAPQLKLQNPIDSNSSQGAANSLSAGQLLFGATGAYPLTAKIESLYNADASYGRSANLVFSNAAGDGTLAERMRIDVAGNVGIGVTSPACILDISGSTGGQIKFPATQNVSSDANTLDDYEEGTFSFTANPDTGGVTLQNATGYYTKIGRLVNIRAYVDVASVSSPSGNIYFTAPFVGRRATAVGSIDANGTFNSFTGLTLVVKIQATQSFFYLQTFNSSVGGIGAAASYLKAGSAFNVNITYETD